MEIIGPVTYTACRYIVSTFLLVVYKVLVHSRIAVNSRYVLVGEKVFKQDENSWKEFYKLMFWSSIQAVVGTGTCCKTWFITFFLPKFMEELHYQVDLPYNKSD